MRKQIGVALLIALTAWPAFADDPMRKLDFLVGEWKGEGVMQMGPEKRETVLQTESVRSLLGGRVLLIEGLGKRKNSDGTTGDTVHEALGVISYDAAAKEYVFDAHTAQQGSVRAKLECFADGTGAAWGFATPQGGRVRYTIRRTEKGEWNEIGEFTRDGEKWMKFFEMTLTKVR